MMKKILLLIMIMVVNTVSPFVGSSYAEVDECLEDAIIFDHPLFTSEECSRDVFCTSSTAIIVDATVLNPLPQPTMVTGVSDLQQRLQPYISGAQKYKSFYESTSSSTGIPWPLIAAIHGRETSFSRTNPGNGQGLFQFASRAASGQTFSPGPVSDDDFAKQLQLLGEDLKTRYGYTDGSEDNIKMVFFSYNGQAGVYKEQAQRLGFSNPADGSPYVMNLADSNRDSRTNSSWVQIRTDHGSPEKADLVPGAFLIYSALGGAQFGNGGVCVSSGSGVVDIARAELAKGIKEIPKDCDINGSPSCGTEIDKYTDNHPEFWCADFVSWVFREAGKPFTGGSSGGWRIPAVASLATWFQNNATYLSGTEIPQPGDVIFINYGRSVAGTTQDGDHTGIVERVEGNTVYTIEGNSSDAVSAGRYAIGDSKIMGYGRLQ